MSAPAERQWALMWPAGESDGDFEEPEIRDGERDARRTHAQYPDSTRLVSRAVTYGPWEDAS